ncbi:unnamed protein product [Bathycoccus prasinos]
MSWDQFFNDDDAVKSIKKASNRLRPGGNALVAINVTCYQFVVRGLSVRIRTIKTCVENAILNTPTALSVKTY